MIVKCIKDFVISPNDRKEKIFLSGKDYIFKGFNDNGWYLLIAEYDKPWQLAESAFEEHFLSVDKYRKIKLDKIC